MASTLLTDVLDWWMWNGNDDTMMMPTNENRAWVGAMFGSILVGLSGVLPLLVMPIDHTYDLSCGDGANRLKALLSFAVGGLLGDVFLHSLPEIWANDVQRDGDGHLIAPSMSTGLLILAGLIMFIVFEKSFTILDKYSQSDDGDENDAISDNNNTKKVMSNETKKQQMTGYLNLAANAIDNFAHGLSLGGAFLVSSRLGFLTTAAILVHEIPHEVGDFAILLKAGFTRADAAVFQLMTAGGGLLGAFVAVACGGSAEDPSTSWILPFSAGTFLHIALVTILPDLLKEDDPKESFKQLICLIFGIIVMAFVSNVFD